MKSATARCLLDFVLPFRNHPASPAAALRLTNMWRCGLNAAQARRREPPDLFGIREKSCRTQLMGSWEIWVGPDSALLPPPAVLSAGLKLATFEVKLSFTFMSVQDGDGGAGTGGTGALAPGGRGCWHWGRRSDCFGSGVCVYARVHVGHAHSLLRPALGQCGPPPPHWPAAPPWPLGRGRAGRHRSASPRHPPAELIKQLVFSHLRAKSWWWWGG